MLFDLAFPRTEGRSSLPATQAHARRLMRERAREQGRFGSVTGPVLLLTFLTACSSEGPAGDGTWHGTIDSAAAGYTIVRNPSVGIWSSGERWRIRQEIVIGGEEGSGKELGDVWDLAVDQAGRIYVLLTRQAEIRVFDSTGSAVRTLGGRGNGPGELSFPTKMDLDQSGRLWVVDPTGGRYVVFDPSGEAADHRRRLLGGECRPAFCGWFDTESRLWDGHLYFVPPAPGVPMVSIIRLDTAMAATDSVTLSLDFPGHPRQLVIIPFEPRVVFTFDRRGYVWTGLNAEYSFAQRSIENDTVRVVTRDAESIPLGKHDLDAATEAVERFNRLAGMPTGRRTQVPTSKPLFAELSVDDQGYLWVAPAGAVDGVTRILDVFNPDGYYLGVAEADFDIAVPSLATPPANPTPILVVGDHLYATITTELGEVFVVKARIEGRHGP